LAGNKDTGHSVDLEKSYIDPNLRNIVISNLWVNHSLRLERYDKLLFITIDSQQTKSRT